VRVTVSVSPGVVLIGRNEGERLARSLASVLGAGSAVLYVDSGSSDGSVALAKSRGCAVLELDPATPFSAARARNEGLAELLRRAPGLALVQFVDGDCEIASGWLSRAAAELEKRTDVAAVCGQLRERHPEVSIYNRLCELEWQGPAGEVAACGGNAMFRVAAFRAAGGFAADLLAGEEPELCLRLRRAGWKILRVDAEMATHDAAMTRLRDWRERTIRSGLAYAQASAMHGRGPERFCVRENASILIWSLVLPALALAALVPTRGASLALFALYPLLALRIALGRWRGGNPPGHACLYAVFCVLGKWPQLAGQLRFLRSGTRHRASTEGSP
jgi:GT2 family glycosyltransferase